MLALAKDSINFSVSKDASYWTNPDGASLERWGVTTWNSHNLLVLREDLEDTLLDYLKEELYLDVTLDKLQIFDDGRIVYDQIEDGDGNEIEDIDTYKEKMYLCDSDIMIQFNGDEPTKEDLKILFPNIKEY